MNTDKHRYKIGFQVSGFRFQVLRKSASICVHLWLISLCVFAPVWKTSAQVKPIYDYGAIGLGQLLKKLNTTASVMMTGAHPDDEDSALLAYLARHDQARTAYLSLTRGDGGQNRLGAELFESLGIIRTEELLQARRLDGAQQFFTRAFDYGFSKTLTEAKEKWDEKIILCDTVRAIRTFRPMVVISRFAGTPADGHGQHQYAGYITPLAVKAAADAAQCTDAGAPWQVLKFYVEQGFRSEAQPTLKLNTGEYDFLLGRSYAEIAAEGRSQHRTQEQGGLELKGDRFSGLNLIESKVPKVEKETSVFDGISTTLKTLQSFGNGKFLEDTQTSAAKALSEYETNNPRKILSTLLEGYKAMGEAIGRASHSACNNNDSNFVRCMSNLYFINLPLLEKQDEFIGAIKLASGIQFDALADKETIAPDESFLVTSRVFFPNAENVKVKEIKLQTPTDWQVSKADAPKENNQGFFRREVANETAYFNVKVPKDAKPTQPFWLEKVRKGDLFDLPTDKNLIEPFQKPLISAEVKIEINGTLITINQPVEYRFADDIRGEIRRDLNVVPKISLSLDQNLILVSGVEKSHDRNLVLSITNNSAATVSGTAKLDLPAGWQAVSYPKNFSLKNKGEKTSVEFVITVPRNYKLGSYEIGAEVEANGESFNQTMHEIAYPHIQTHRFYTDAKTKISVLDLKVAPVKVGYITGSGDNVAEAIRQMGLSVEFLNENDLTGGDLSRFDVIVVGIRASETRMDFVANNQRLLDYVKNGGNLIVQYQRPIYENSLPFPAKIGARVVDENAKITILDATNPIFNFPNKITDEDFKGWVQERNLYSFTTFDAKYKPLLEAHDAGEPENKGGLVIAEIGKGKYIYCSYAFFRQLPAGVSGAYRLFANLLSLPKAK